MNFYEDEDFDYYNEEDKVDLKKVEKEAKDVGNIKTEDADEDFDSDDDLFADSDDEDDFFSDDEDEDDEDENIFDEDYIDFLSEQEELPDEKEIPAKKEKVGLKDGIKKQIEIITMKLSKLAPSSSAAKTLKEKRKKLRARAILATK
jgi:hypothetical protein